MSSLLKKTASGVQFSLLFPLSEKIPTMQKIKWKTEKFCHGKGKKLEEYRKSPFEFMHVSFSDHCMCVSVSVKGNVDLCATNCVLTVTTGSLIGLSCPV